MWHPLLACRDSTVDGDSLLPRLGIPSAHTCLRFFVVPLFSVFFLSQSPFLPQRSFIIQSRLIECHRLVFTRYIHPTFFRQLSRVLALKAYCFYAADNWILNLSLFCFPFSLGNMEYDFLIAFSIRVFPQTCFLKSLCDVICTRGSDCRYSPVP